MSNHSRVAGAAALAAVVAAGAAALELGAGIPAADTKMTGVDGRALSIAEVKGPKGTLVLFTCNHCPYVKAWDARLAALGNEYAVKGIGVVAVNANDAEKYPDDGLPGMVERARQLGLAYPYVVDATSKVARAFGATRTPEAFLFDAAGSLVYHGTVDDNGEDAAKVTRRYLADALAAVVEGKAPPVAETKAIGCSIKFRPGA